LQSSTLFAEYRFYVGDEFPPRGSLDCGELVASEKESSQMSHERLLDAHGPEKRKQASRLEKAS
jgi:hypothetical protein